ncbi:MAG: S8 family serine peptidase, partial [Halobaculum sp.]
MSRETRRTFLELTGAALGGIALGSTVTAAERTDRFLVSTRGNANLGKLTVVYEMPGVEYAVVRGTEREVRRAVSEYAPDVEIRLDQPDLPSELSAEQGIFDVPAERNDEDLYDLAWDKQAQSIKDAQQVTRGEGTRVAVIDDGVYADHPDLNVNGGLSRNFTRDDNGIGPLFDDHGTHVAGTIAAEDDGTGVLGTAPGAEIVDLRV